VSVEDFFSATFRAARTRFLEAARSRAAVIQSHVHPSQRGPAGEELATDVALLGSSSSKSILMIVSGTHGVEGFAGSGCQIAFLQSKLCEQVTASCRVVLVHAVNPYGFAYVRRTNEDNIDLNRNFVDFSRPLPQNPAYAESARALLPSGPSLEEYTAARDRLEREAVSRGGYQFLKSALQPGQYDFPQGLYYGGAAPAWSSRIFLQICRREFADCDAAAVLDLHTGLGSPGVGELIFMSWEQFERHRHSFPGPVSCAGRKTSVTASVNGALVSAACNAIPAATAIGCALEFGTVTLEENMRAKIFENWTYYHLPPQHVLRRESSQRFKNAYFCDSLEWKAKVIARSAKVVSSLHRWLRAAPPRS
jgi:predicted deacylase